MDRISAELAIKRLKSEIQEIVDKAKYPLRHLRYGNNKYEVVQWLRTIDEEEALQGRNLDEFIQRLEAEIQSRRQKYQGKLLASLVGLVKEGEYWEEQEKHLNECLKILMEAQAQIKPREQQLEQYRKVLFG